MSEAALLGIDMRSLNRERFSSRQHRELMARHEIELQRFYGHGDSNLLHRLDIALDIELTRLKQPPVSEPKPVRRIFEPTDAQLAIAITALENAA